MLARLIRDENGFIVSAELMLVVTLMFCAAAVGFSALRDALVNELNDISHAIGAVSQTYHVTGLKKARSGCGCEVHARCAGFGFNDDADECDCRIIEYVTVCGKDDPSTGADE